MFFVLMAALWGQREFGKGMIVMALVLSSIVAVVMGIGVLIVRMKASSKPASGKKIILPPLFMSTGALMFLFPMFRVTKMELLEAVIVGALFSIVLIKTSRFEIRDGNVYLIRSKAFAIVLIGLLAVRLAGKFILSSSLDVGQLSGMFYLLAFSMLVPWRAAMYVQYKNLAERLRKEKSATEA